MSRPRTYVSPKREAQAAANNLGAGVTAPPALLGFCRLNPGPALYLNRVELIPTTMD